MAVKVMDEKKRKPRILKPAANIGQALVDRRNKMRDMLCEVCKDYADLENWNSQEIQDGACIPCYEKLQKADLVD